MVLIEILDRCTHGTEEQLHGTSICSPWTFSRASSKNSCSESPSIFPPWPPIIRARFPLSSPSPSMGGSTASCCTARYGCATGAGRRYQQPGWLPPLPSRAIPPTTWHEHRGNLALLNRLQQQRGILTSTCSAQRLTARWDGQHCPAQRLTARWDGQHCPAQRLTARWDGQHCPWASIETDSIIERPPCDVYYPSC